MAGVNATGGQDVDPDVFELERLVAQIEIEILHESRHMFVQQGYQILEDRKPPGQVGQRCIGCVTGIALIFAPLLAGLIVICDDKARIFQLARINRAMGGQRGVIKAGGEQRFDIGHAAVLPALPRVV